MGNVLDILKETGAVIADSHFVLTSGKHAPIYFSKDALYPHTDKTSEVCREFAERVKDLGIDVVVGPALGGIILSQWTAHYLSQIKGREILGVYTEKTPDNGQILTRGYDKVVTGKKVLVVEDLTSTGESAKKVVDAITSAGGKVVGVCVMLNRNPEEVKSAYFGVPFFAMETFKVDSYEEKDCPLCKAGIPINTMVGHGKKYLAAKQQ